MFKFPLMNLRMFLIFVIILIFCLIFGDLRTYKENIKNIWYRLFNNLKRSRRGTKTTKVKKIIRLHGLGNKKKKQK